MSFKVTYHAGQRFLERVMGLNSYTKKDVIDAINIIRADIYNIVTSKKRFILPSFPKFNLVVRDNTIVTLIPKPVKVLQRR
jgi:nucleoid DNA-binding protein